MHTTHPLTIDSFFSSLSLQITRTFQAWHITIPNFIPFLSTIVLLLALVFLLRKIAQIIRIVRSDQVFLELTPPAFTDKSAYTTQQLFLVLHDIGRQLTFLDRLLGFTMLFSFEIVSTRKEGIRYIIRTTSAQKDSVKRAVVAYLPQVRVREVSDYIPHDVDSSQIRIDEFSLRKHFAFPLAKQNVLSQHDPVAYITGMMTQLEPDELVCLQIVTSPTVSEQTTVIANKILRNEDVLKHLKKSQANIILKVFAWIVDTVLKIIQETIWGIFDILTANPNRERYAYQQAAMQQYQRMEKLRPARVLSTFEQDIVSSVQEKIDQPLFETNIRSLVMLKGVHKQKERLQGIRSSLAVFSVPKYQSLVMTNPLPVAYVKKLQLLLFRKRLLSLLANRSTSLLSASEIASLYHFPFTGTTQTENIAKVLSKKLPAPLSLKRERALAVIFGQNTYGDSKTPIGLTKEERETPMYVIGRTGSGKTTLLSAMAVRDIQDGRGMAFIDPHGDVAEDLVYTVPLERKDDLIYLNPIDMGYPIHINLLELTPGLSEDEEELEKERVCEGVISLFRKVFSKDEQTNAHRIENVLRKVIYTAFAIEGATIFTLDDLLNNPPFLKKVIPQLVDPHVKNFWKYEYGRAGEFQIVKMAGGVTAKVGRLLSSPIAKRMLEEPKSTISFDDILREGKILICNFSKGIGEDTSNLLGTMVITKLQEAALRRARIPKEKRTPFYLYVDEFQNFATPSFITLLSESRKYGLSICMAEQSTSQQKDRTIVQNILANVTKVISFRSANPVDEELMLTQFAPYVEKGDITNLPRYHFYIKISALEPEEPFSGETIVTPIDRDPVKYQQLIAASRSNYAKKYIRKNIKQKKIVIDKESLAKDEPRDVSENKTTETGASGALPVAKTYNVNLVVRKPSKKAKKRS